MAFEIRKIGDVGAAHPVVARLGAQTAELTGFLDIDDKSRATINHLYAITLQERLLRCHAFREDLVARVNAAVEAIQKQNNPQIREVPNVIGLQGIAEGFLYEAKNYLRDLLQLFRVAFECTLTEASAFTNLKDDGDSELVKWAIATFGEDDDLPKLLRTERAWIAELIRARNAVEHPGELSGTLNLNNIRIADTKPGAYIPPTWQRTGGPEGSIVADMDTGLSNMLTLAEDLLVEVIKHKSKAAGIIEFLEIPENDRDPNCPIRLRVGLKREIQAQLRARQQPPPFRQPLTAAQRKERLARYKARAWGAKKLLRSQDRAWREKKKHEVTRYAGTRFG